MTRKCRLRRVRERVHGCARNGVSRRNHSVVVACDPVVRITITPAAYAAIKPSLAKGANEPPPQRDAAGRFVIYVEEADVDQLKALRRSCHTEAGRTGGNKGARGEAR
jgi:hypothetical protein